MLGVPPVLLGAGLFLFGVIPGCYATSGRAPDLSQIPAMGMKLPEDVVLPGGEPVFVPAEHDGMKGGRLIYDLPGHVDDVLAMLMDFEHAEHHRSWASKYRLIERKGDRAVAEWKFHGRFGIEPKVQIQFATFHRGSKARVNFALKKTAFGMAGFTGEHSLSPLPGDPPRVRIESTLFIDSGIFFAGASREDIEKRLRADARLMTEWMQARLGESV